MSGYVAQRAAQAIILLLLVSVVGYGIMSVAPGGPLAVYLHNPQVTPQKIDLLRHQLGLDRPWYLRYFHWLAGLLRGQWGYSYYTGRPVLDMIGERLPATFQGRTVLGSGTDMDVQRRAGIEQADAFVACTPGDNRNIAACQIAREMFQVPKVVARINDPLREKIFRDLGLQTVCPTLVGAELVRDALLRGS